MSSGFGSAHSFNGPMHSDKLESRLKYALRLYEVMESIGRLRNIFAELLDVGSVNLEEVDYGDDKDNKMLQLTVIPLALHNGS